MRSCSERPVLTCDVSGGCPCFALPAASCFARDRQWRFQASGRHAERSLARHRAFHALHEGRAAELQKLTATVERVGKSWSCISCGKVFKRLNLLLMGHACRPAISALGISKARRARGSIRRKQLRPSRRFCVLKQMRLRRKTRPEVAVSAPEVTAQPYAAATAHAIALPRDLAYPDVAQATKRARSSATVAMQFNASSVFNASRLRALLGTGSRPLGEPVPAAGETIWLPESKCFATVVSAECASEVSVLQYECVGEECGCDLHASDGAGPCWRLKRPLRSATICLQVGMRCPEILVPRAGAPGKAKSGMDKPWQRCYRVAKRSSENAHEVASAQAEDLLATAADAFADSRALADGFTQLCADIYEAVAMVAITYADSDGVPEMPSICPGAEGGCGPCHIVRAGRRPGPRVLSSEGVRRSTCQRYMCRAHDSLWSIPLADCADGRASITADVVGDFLVTGDFWPSVLLIFEETECYEAVRRQVTAATSDFMARALSMHPRISALSSFERAVLLCAFGRAADVAPAARSLAALLSAYANAVLAPMSVSLSRYALAATGAVLNMDFSVSDCRQLSCRALGGRAARKRTFGGITGLDDIPPLPPMYCGKEDRPHKEKLLLAALTLMHLDGLRPMGVNTDNLLADFSMVISCLQAVLPRGTVVLVTNPSDDLLREELSQGHIVVDHSNFRVFGFELGEDPLHVYMRLLGTVHYSSCESAWLIRCLRKALGSWNPLVRGGHERAEHQDGLDEQLYAADDTPESRGAPCAVVSLQAILSAYFNAKRLPKSALKMVSAKASETWTHPFNGAAMPPCAKAVIIDDIARWAHPGVARSHTVAIAYRACYAQLPTAQSIQSDLHGLAQLVRRRCFANVQLRNEAAWYRAQLTYLQRLRRRPCMRRGGDDQSVPISLLAVPAGQQLFQNAVTEQCKDVHVHGLMAAFRIKAWAHAHGFEISLGSIGVERLWRNIQRQARNKGRSQASLNTIDILILSRWMRLMQSRFLRVFHAQGDANAAHLAQLLLSKEKLAVALTGETKPKAPLAAAGRVPALPLSEAEVGRVYHAFEVGSL